MNLRDPYGKPVNIGTKVAYNYSGQVALGTVLDITKTRSYTRTVYWLKVRRDSVFADGYKRNETSKVKVNNVCVLDTTGEET